MVIELAGLQRSTTDTTDKELQGIPTEDLCPCRCGWAVGVVWAETVLLPLLQSESVDTQIVSSLYPQVCRSTMRNWLVYWQDSLTFDL
jgi:hypothetical protein